MFDCFAEPFLRTKLSRKKAYSCGLRFQKLVTVSDPAGNAKLAKSGEGSKRGRAKDDSAAAAILAVAEGMRRRGLVTSNTLNYAICGLSMSKNHVKLDQKRWEYVRKQVFERDGYKCQSVRQTRLA